LRSEARESVAALHALGLRTVLRTGDAKPVAESIAKEVGIDIIHAEVLPDQKGEVIRQLVRDGRKVAMVGNRINKRAQNLPLDTDEFVLSELDRTRLLEYAKRYPVVVENEIVRLLAHLPNSNKQFKDVRYLAPAQV